MTKSCLMITVLNLYLLMAIVTGPYFNVFNLSPSLKPYYHHHSSGFHTSHCLILSPPLFKLWLIDWSFWNTYVTFCLKYFCCSLVSWWPNYNFLEEYLGFLLLYYYHNVSTSYILQKHSFTYVLSHMLFPDLRHNTHILSSPNLGNFIILQIPSLVYAKDFFWSLSLSDLDGSLKAYNSTMFLPLYSSRLLILSENIKDLHYMVKFLCTPVNVNFLREDTF